MAAVIMNVLMMNFAWQGMLDLHAMLRNPNQGKLVGHMPTPVFLDFTKRVCYNTVEYLSTAPHNNDGHSLRTSQGNYFTNKVLGQRNDFFHPLPHVITFKCSDGIF